MVPVIFVNASTILSLQSARFRSSFSVGKNTKTSKGLQGIPGNQSVLSM